jgi:hypothetical protein
MTKIILLVASLALSACASQATIGGKSVDGKEVFTGQAIGKWRQEGIMYLSTGRGVSCQGKFNYSTSNVGGGVAFCDDGQTAHFSFITFAGQGQGHGLYGNKPFTFTFTR